jgi:hypothetical protein
MPEFPKIKDIAEPVEPAAQLAPPWLWWTGVAVLSLLVLAGLVLWIRSARRRVRFPGLPSLPEKIALQALESLRQRADSLPPEEFANELSQTVRTFLQRQTGVLALYSTSPEMLGERSRPGEPPPPPAITAFREVFLASDVLKYGAPRADKTTQATQLIDSAIAAIRLAALPPAAAPAAAPAIESAANPAPTGTTPPQLPDAHQQLRQ